jgi:hypothetical protein
MTEHRHLHRSRFGLRRLSFRAVSLFLLLSVALTFAACVPSGGSGQNREAALRQIAADYAANSDLAQAQSRLDDLKLANPGQLLVSLAEADLAAGRAREEVEATARLAEMLGARSQKLIAYLSPKVTAPAVIVEPTVMAATVQAPASETVAPAATDVPAPTSVPPTATELPATSTAAPPTSSPTPEPQTPRVAADSAVNLRGGPGKAYPVVGRLAAGQEVPIIARNESGDWWQIEYSAAGQAWVAGTVIRVLGAIDTVAVAQNIPVLPTQAPRPTAASQPTAAPVAQPPAPPVSGGPEFRLVEVRLWNVTENGGFYDSGSVHCGEKRELHIYVQDKAGAPLDMVTLLATNPVAQDFNVTGSKGPGHAEYVMGGLYDVRVVKDVDGREVTSDSAVGMTANSEAIANEVLIGAGYCRDVADCEHFKSQRGCYGHHSWTVTFRRSY